MKKKTKTKTKTKKQTKSTLGRIKFQCYIDKPDMFALRAGSEATDVAISAYLRRWIKTGIAKNKVFKTPTAARVV